MNEALLKQAWELGFKLCRSYGDNHAHFAGEQKEKAWKEAKKKLGLPGAHGFVSRDPLKIEDGIDYENRNVKCAYCGAEMPHAPWPTNSENFIHRPRCGSCGSPMTFPIPKEGGQ